MCMGGGGEGGGGGIGEAASARSRRPTPLHIPAAAAATPRAPATSLSRSKFMLAPLVTATTAWGGLVGGGGARGGVTRRVVRNALQWTHAHIGMADNTHPHPPPTTTHPPVCPWDAPGRCSQALAPATATAPAGSRMDRVSSNTSCMHWVGGWVGGVGRVQGGGERSAEQDAALGTQTSTHLDGVGHCRIVHQHASPPHTHTHTLMALDTAALSTSITPSSRSRQRRKVSAPTCLTATPSGRQGGEGGGGARMVLRGGGVKGWGGRRKTSAADADALNPAPALLPPKRCPCPAAPGAPPPPPPPPAHPRTSPPWRG